MRLLFYVTAFLGLTVGLGIVPLMINQYYADTPSMTPVTSRCFFMQILFTMVQ